MLDKVATRGYLVDMGDIKNNLSDHLRDVRRGARLKDGTARRLLNQGRDETRE